MTRRQWLTWSGLAVAGACSRKKASGYDGYALIATSGDESLAVVDLTAFRSLTPIALGAAPTAVLAASRQGNSYVLTRSTGTIHEVNGELVRVSSKKIAKEVSAIRMMPDGKRLLAIGENSRELIETVLPATKVVGRHRLEAPPIDLEVGPDQYAAVSTGEHGIIQLFNFETGRNSRVQMEGKIGAVRFRGDGKALLVANLSGRSLTALAVPSLEVIADLPLAMIRNRGRAM